MDAFYLADCLRALNLNPTIALCKKLGMEEQKKTKDCGSYEYFMEVLKLYDKEGNGTMLYAELEHILCSLGERMEKEEVIPVLAETCPEEDEDGFIPFEPFVKAIVTMKK